MEGFFKNSIITFFAQIAVFIFSFIGLIIVSRVLGPEGRGIYSLIILIPSLMISFGSFGIDSSNTYFVGREKYSVKDVISNSILSSFILGGILILVFFGMIHLDSFKNFLYENKIPISYLWLSVLTIPVYLLVACFRGILCGKQEIRNFNWTRVIEGLAEFIAIIVFVIVLKTNLLGALISKVISILSAAVFTIILVRKFGRFRLSFNKKLLKDSFLYGGKVYLANMTSFLSYRIDMFLVALFLNPVAVGFYSISVSMAEKLFMVPSAFATVLFPKVSSIESHKADNFTPKVVRHTLFIMILFSLALAFLIKPIVIIFFGKVFLESVIPFIVLLPGIIAYGVGGVIAADLSGRGKPQYAIYSTIVCLTINIPLNIYLIPKWGIVGASFASSVAYWADTLVVLIAFINISKKSVTEVLFMKKDDFKDYQKVIKKIINYDFRKKT